MEMITIGFDFNGTTYQALVRDKKNSPSPGYAITIMNGPLEQKFFGHHFIREEAGRVVYDLAPDTEIGQLKYVITRSLDCYLKHAG